MSERKRGELALLQDEISTEIRGDAPEIAAMVFGSHHDQPDVVNVQNERLDDIYRQAYTSGDRTFLQREAQRNPEQFLKVAERLGVSVPQVAPGAQSPVPPSGAFAKAATAALPSPPVAAPPPVVPGLPVPVPLEASAVSPPVILGPNGQPLPPGGTVGV
jgi:hypothetical protein